MLGVPCPEEKNIKKNNDLVNTHAGTPWNKLFTNDGAYVGFRPVNQLLTFCSLAQSIIRYDPSRIPLAALAVLLETTPQSFCVKNKLGQTLKLHVVIYSVDRVPPSIDLTFASFGFNHLVLYLFLLFSNNLCKACFYCFYHLSQTRTLHSYAQLNRSTSKTSEPLYH